VRARYYIAGVSRPLGIQFKHGHGGGGYIGAVDRRAKTTLVDAASEGGRSDGQVDGGREEWDVDTYEGDGMWIRTRS